MITKAYIQSTISTHSAIVRIPLYNKIQNVNGATPESELPIASISLPPGMEYDLEAGDVVFVEFEEDNVSNPVIIGLLSRSNKKGSIINNTKVRNLQVEDASTLSYNTQIGDVAPHSIKCLKGLSPDQNIRDKFTELDNADTQFKKDLNNLQTEDSLIKKDIKNMQEDIVLINSTNTQQDLNISVNKTEIDSLKLNKIDKNNFILGSGAYGDTLPTSMTEGQIFFLSLSSYEALE